MTKYNTQNLKPFKKGQSGNPAGRKKGSKNYSTRIKEALELVATSDDYKIEDGDLIERLTELMGKEKITKGDVMIYKLILEATKNNNLQAISQILDRTEGKPKQENINVNHNKTYTSYLDELPDDEV